MSTVLGSCVAVCLWDPEAAVGGMNHFLLPFGPELAGGGPVRYGVHAMEVLINALLKQRARRGNLRAKLFGGARITTNLGDIGAANARFAQEFLATEEIPCVAESLGGTSARRIMFRPSTGHVRQLLVPNSTVPTENLQPLRRPEPRRDAIELF